MFGGSAFFKNPYFDELGSWLLSTVPAVAVGVLAVPLVIRRLDREMAFVAMSALGLLILWSIWDAWFIFPGDWDITATLALCLQVLSVQAVLRLRWALGQWFGLGLIAAVSASNLVVLSWCFGLPARL